MKPHYKKILIVFFFSMQFSFLNAQWVTIPDSNFVTYLQNNFPSCMNGNLMDTTCTTLVNATSVNCSNKNIIDLEGIQYFDNLDTLICAYNNLYNLPDLPVALTSLTCGNNNLTALPSLPNSLINLYCGNNQIAFLPSLPNSLILVDCQANQLTSLPSLPSLLNVLGCNNNQITILPPLPASLLTLNCPGNQLTNLPALPGSLYDLWCSSNPLTTLPTLPGSLLYLICSGIPYINLPSLPSNLTQLICSYDSLTILPTLPGSLTELDCSHNQLSTLPTLPDYLKEIHCNNNLLTILTTLPDSLEFFDCSGNQLSNLPFVPDSVWFLSCAANQISSFVNLPYGLLQLQCGGNQLSNLPAFPPSIYYLSCELNQLVTLPPLPNSIHRIICYSSPLTSLPDLPDSLYQLDIHDNPNLECLPELKRIVNFQFSNTGIQCLPNYGNVTSSTPPLSSLPLCDLFNTNNCTAYWNISGKVYNDSNSNCITDNNELRMSNFKLMLDSAGTLIQQTYTGGEGFYSFDTNTGTYTYTVDTTDLPVMVTCPVSGFQTSVLTALDSMDYNMDFGMQCKPGFDVGVTSVAVDSGIFRPAHLERVKISAGDISNFYGLHCAAGTSGSVQVVYSGAASYVSATAGALTPVVSGDTLLYSIADFGTVNYNSDFSFTMQTDTAAAIGSQVCFDVNVSPTAGDINPANNSLHYCFTVVNSFDPNTKEVFPEGNIDTSQHWLTYTINFQNTGTAAAQHIYVLDTLDNSLDESSFTLLSYSFQPLTQVMGKVISFNFPNINLPDSTSDEPHSHGYVQYKVKIKPGLTNGTLIHNTADIIFDFNTPVTTNTTENQIMITTNLTPNPSPKERGIWLSPNPFHNSTLLKITSPMKPGNYTLEIYNVIGEKMREINCLNKSEIVIERKNLEAGIYIFKLFNERELMGTGKLVVE
jgi:uncharacterized repeat protein (TIGR01451 family)